MPNTTKMWHVRAALYELLAFSFRYPDTALSQAVVSGEWLDAAKEITKALDLDWECATCSENSNDAEAFLHALRAEATYLFIGAPDPAVSPYEGIWRAEDDGVQGLLFVNPHSMDVERFCNACGLGQPEGTNEPLDYVATELELLQYLAMLASGVDASQTAVSLEDLPGGTPEAAFQQFMDNHVQTWMPRFADKVCEQARIPFYRNAASLLKCTLS
ncbi:molecular chaperone [Adlercreutzia sp. ZJ154]|uniref:TorD/DmsD family molecular chaperone n=1 Tax=Adlercreutzia sp. ZJ154 TaxID=2709790 RepID=UPI0013EB71DA|nr:molecular chaperone TorD family protein [Adlercreutzia sp. ZJ154]